MSAKEEPYTGERFAGLPQTSKTTVGYGQPVMSYTLPGKMLGMSWKASGRPDSDLTFTLSEITPDGQEAAIRASGGDQAILGRELVFQVIRSIGERKINPMNGSDREEMKEWWESIGPRGRRLVDAAFLSMTHPSEGDVATFLNSGIIRI